MEKLSTLNEKLFNQNNLKKILKRGLQAGILGAALATGTVMGTGCKTDVKTPDNGIEDIGGQGGNGTVDTTTYGAEQKLGNGNYKFFNFLGGKKELKFGNDDNEYREKYNDVLAEGKTYFKGEVAKFQKSLEGRPAAQSYFGAYMNFYNDSINSQDPQRADSYFHINEVNPGGDDLDATMNKITYPCNQYFADIIKNIKTDKDRDAFILCYRALSNEVYYQGSGNTREYQQVVNELSELWKEWQVSEAFDIETDIKNNYQQITKTMDTLLGEAAANIGHNVTANDLRQIVNLSFVAESLHAVHNLSRSRLQHKTCVADNQIVPTMENTADEMYKQGRSIIQDQGMTR